MADYHILDGMGDGRTYRVAFHVLVPDEANRAGVNLRVAVVQDPARDTASVVPWIQAAEQAQLDNGELVEIIKPYSRKAGASQVEDRDALDALFTAGVPKMQNKLRQAYQYWGFDRDIP